MGSPCTSKAERVHLVLRFRGKADVPLRLQNKEANVGEGGEYLGHRRGFYEELGGLSRNLLTRHGLLQCPRVYLRTYKAYRPGHVSSAVADI